MLTGAGVGGGSLVYATTLYEPPEAFYRDKQWDHITDWRDELAPFYDQAKRMLGVRGYPRVSPSDRMMCAVAEDMGVGDTYHPRRSACSSATGPASGYPTRSSVVSGPPATPARTAASA